MSDMQNPSTAPVALLGSPASDSCSTRTSDRPQHDAKQLSATLPDLHRARKRVPWRGKTCIISLPPTSTTASKDLWCLRRSDVDQRIHSWQAQKCYTAQSELGARLDNCLCQSDLSTQTRSPFPDFADILAEREKRPYRARIPDRAQWESYVDSVREEKLRALGVTLPKYDFEISGPPVPNPFTPYTISRGSRVPVSPSTGPSMAPSSGDPSLTQPYHVPKVTQETPSASSCTSPIATYDMPSSKPVAKHFSKKSIAHLQTSTGSASPFHGLAPQSSAFQLRKSEDHKKTSIDLTNISMTNEIGSPRLSVFSNNEAHSASESNNAIRGYSAEDLTTEAKPNQINGEGQTRSDDSPNHQAGLPKIVTPDLQYPVPRSHHERISETLERSLRKAQDNDPMVQYQSQRANSLVQPHSTTSDNKFTYTQSSQSTNIARATQGPSNSHKHAQHGNLSDSVGSGLNALAPEFKSHITELPTSSTMVSTTMRPTAPAFMPIGASQLAPLSREFSFSSTGPRFKPSVVFNRMQFPSERSPAERSNGVFGIVTQSLGSKSTKKSRAIPILKPGNGLTTSGSEDEVQEDESGRITQAEGRQKRMRRSSQGTELGSEHAFTSQVPFLTAQHQNRDFHGVTPPIHHNHVRQDSSSLEEATLAANRLEEIIDDLSTSEGSNPREPPTQATGIDGQASTVPCIAKRLASDDTHRRPRSLSSLSLQGGGVQAPNTSIVGLLKQPPVAYGFNSRRASSSSIFGSNQTTYAHNLQALANFDARSRGPTNCSGASSSDSTIPAPAAEAGLHRPQNSLAPQDHGGDMQDAIKGVLNGVTYIDPSFEGIEAVLKRQESEDSTVGMKDNSQPHSGQSADNRISTTNSCEDYANSRDAVPSRFQDNVHGPGSASSLSSSYPSYQHLPRAKSESADSSIARMVAENARFSPSYKLPFASRGDSPSLQDTDSAEHIGISERDNAILSGDEVQVRRKQSFLDAQISRVVSSTLQVRLAPLERTLADIQYSLVNLVKQSSASSNSLRKTNKADISDADDEDDVRSERSKTKSPTRYRSIDRFKTLAAQIATVQQDRAPAQELTNIMDEIKELKAVLQDTRLSFTDVKTVVEETIVKQMRGRSGPITSSHQSATVEKNQLQISGLESMLKIAEARAEDEMKARRATEDALADAQRLLRLSLQDAAEQRESAEETERSLSAFHEERHEVLRRNALLEGTQESLQQVADGLAEKNSALEGTLEEYRLSSAHWRDDIDTVRAENSNLRRTVEALKNELEDGIRGRQALRTKFNQLQEELVLASQNIAQGQSAWHCKEEEHQIRYEVLAANYERENQRCRKMETEIAELCKNSRLDKEERQQIITKLEHEARKQREAMILEQDRVQKIMDPDRKAAMDQLKALCTNLSNATVKFEAQLDEANQKVRSESTKYEQLLQESTASMASALRDQQNFHDQVLKDSAEQYEHIQRTIVGERQSIETDYRDRLALAGEKMLHYRDKISHLEDKLKISQSAAQAAVQASQSKQPMATHSHQPQAPLSDSVPEKISPQALRESILVLQEQLQERETKIEQLEHKLSALG
ncbi:MAG: hypothetical protein L6R41_000118, partial [Letrouitia leprolyta]